MNFGSSAAVAAEGPPGASVRGRLGLGKRVGITLALGLALVALRLALGGGLPVPEPAAHEAGYSARRIATGHPFSRNTDHLGALALLALAFRIVPASDSALIAISALVFASIVAAGLAVGHLTLGPRAGILAATLLAVFPPFAARSTGGGTGDLGPLLLLLGLGALAATARPFLAALFVGGAIAMIPALASILPGIVAFLASRSRVAGSTLGRVPPWVRVAGLVVLAVLLTLAEALAPESPAEAALALAGDGSLAARSFVAAGVAFALSTLALPDVPGPSRTLHSLVLSSLLCAAAGGAMGLGYRPLYAFLPLFLVCGAAWMARAFSPPGRRPWGLLLVLLCVGFSSRPRFDPYAAKTRSLYAKLGRFAARHTPADGEILLDPAFEMSPPALSFYSDRAARALGGESLALGRLRSSTFALVIDSNRSLLADESGREPPVVAAWSGPEWSARVLLMRLP